MNYTYCANVPENTKSKYICLMKELELAAISNFLIFISLQSDVEDFKNSSYEFCQKNCQRLRSHEFSPSIEKTIFIEGVEFVASNQFLNSPSIEKTICIEGVEFVASKILLVMMFVSNKLQNGPKALGTEPLPQTLIF